MKKKKLITENRKRKTANHRAPKEKKKTNPREPKENKKEKEEQIEETYVTLSLGTISSIALYSI